MEDLYSFLMHFWIYPDPNYFCVTNPCLELQNDANSEQKQSFTAINTLRVDNVIPVIALKIN